MPPSELLFVDSGLFPFCYIVADLCFHKMDQNFKKSCKHLRTQQSSFWGLTQRYPVPAVSPQCCIALTHPPSSNQYTSTVAEMPHMTAEVLLHTPIPLPMKFAYICHHIHSLLETDLMAPKSTSSFSANYRYKQWLEQSEMWHFPNRSTFMMLVDNVYNPICFLASSLEAPTSQPSNSPTPFYFFGKLTQCHHFNSTIVWVDPNA